MRHALLLACALLGALPSRARPSATTPTRAALPTLAGSTMLHSTYASGAPYPATNVAPLGAHSDLLEHLHAYEVHDLTAALTARGSGGRRVPLHVLGLSLDVRLRDAGDAVHEDYKHYALDETGSRAHRVDPAPLHCVFRAAATVVGVDDVDDDAVATGILPVAVGDTLVGSAAHCHSNRLLLTLVLAADTREGLSVEPLANQLRLTGLPSDFDLRHVAYSHAALKVDWAHPDRNVGLRVSPRERERELHAHARLLAGPHSVYPHHPPP